MLKNKKRHQTKRRFSFKHHPFFFIVAKSIESTEYLRLGFD